MDLTVHEPLFDGRIEVVKGRKQPNQPLVTVVAGRDGLLTANSNAPFLSGA